jgi:hypothetical protein
MGYEMVRRRPIVLAGIFFICMLVTSEIFLRLSGFSSYPVYDIHAETKYIPAANQQGVFLNRNAWYVNGRHMGNIANWNAETHPNIVLIGNSIVFGGNASTHEDKLGPLLEKNLGGRYTVWSVAGGGWTNVNEKAYLKHNPDVLRNADAVIVEFMEGGLSAPTEWPGYYGFPDPSRGF